MEASIPGALCYLRLAHCPSTLAVPSCTLCAPTLCAICGSLTARQRLLPVSTEGATSCAGTTYACFLLLCLLKYCTAQCLAQCVSSGCGWIVVLGQSVDQRAREVEAADTASVARLVGYPFRACDWEDAVTVLS